MVSTLKGKNLLQRKHAITHCIPVDFATVMCWMGPFVILGVPGLFCCFNSIFDGNPVSKQCRP